MRLLNGMSLSGWRRDMGAWFCEIARKASSPCELG